MLFLQEKLFECERFVTHSLRRADQCLLKSQDFRPDIHFIYGKKPTTIRVYAHLNFVTER